MEANLKDIEWLLENVTQYRISKEIDISQSTISLLRSGKRKINKLSFELASKLTEYSRKLQLMEETEKSKCDDWLGRKMGGNS